MQGQNKELKAGQWVEVRSAEEIASTLDDNASLNSMPFMPEMLKFCGRRIRVAKRADKTCDTIEGSGARRLVDTVHLEGARCSGADHGECHASCLLFWKTAWLKPVEGPIADDNPIGAELEPTTESGPRPPELDRIYASTQRESTPEVVYRCQTTELLRASRPLKWWDPRSYVRDLRSGNVKPGEFVRTLGFSGFRALVEPGVAYRPLVGSYDRLQRLLGGSPFPFRTGSATRTPVEELKLRPGEMVRIKSYDEILKTINKENKNRGLFFDAEMVKFCGRQYRVLKRVDHIIDEKTGKMIQLKTPCVILQGVFCKANVSKYRLFCPRGIYSYWREVWLERVR